MLLLEGGERVRKEIQGFRPGQIACCHMKTFYANCCVDLFLLPLLHVIFQLEKVFLEFRRKLGDNSVRPRVGKLDLVAKYPCHCG